MRKELKELANILTDGTGVSQFTVPKIIKDLIVDAILGAGAGFAPINVVSLPQDKVQAVVAFWIVANAVFHALGRAVLKWASN